MNLNIYFVKNPLEEVEYESYEGFVIAAYSKSHARDIANEEVISNEPTDDWSEVPVERVGTYTGDKTEPHIILDAYKRA